MRTTRTGFDSRRRRNHIIDTLVDEYVRWREECSSVTRAYDTWLISPPSEHGMAFAAYVAALDREERAAATYRDRLDLARAA